MNHRPAAPVRERSSEPTRVVSPRPAGLSVAIGSVLGVALPWIGMAAAPGSIVTNGGGTDVQDVAGSPNHWRVISGTVKSRGNTQVAFNDFKTFGVGQGQTVDLILPNHNGNQVYNLVNLVRDERPYINGTLNGFLADQQTVGGRVFFVSSHGMLVGESGVLNVGALSIASANAGTMGDILAGGEALDGLLGGTLTAAQLKGTGKVELKGTVNSRGGVRVQATAIDVTGTLLVESAQTQVDANNQLLHLTPVVNAGQPTGEMELVAEGGKIQLRAADIADTGLGMRTAEASVRVSGTLTADDIALSASAEIDPDHDAQGVAVDNLKADLANSVVDLETLATLGQSLVELGVGELAGDAISALYARTNARVEVTDTARLTAAGDIDLQASTRQRIDNSAVGQAFDKDEIVTDAQGKPVIDPATGKPKAKTHILSLGAAYGQIDATTSVVVAKGATVQAGGNLQLSASADTTLALSAESYGVNNTSTAFTAAISNINVDTRAVIEGGAHAGTVQVGGDLSVSAVNQLDLETRATARTDKNGKVGLAGAVSLQDIQALAAVDRDVAVEGDLTVQGASITAQNLTRTLIAGPEREALEGEEEVDEIITNGGDGLMSVVQSLVGAGVGKALGALTDDGGDDAEPPKPGQTAASPFRLGGAITVVVGEHAATARIGDGVQVRAGGTVVLDSQVVDAQIGNHAISNVQAKGKDNDGADFALSAAVAFADLTHRADTLVGSGADVSAERIGLSSDVRLPRDFSALGDAVPDFSSFDAFTDSLDAIKSAGSALLFDPSDLFTTYAAARGSADQVSIGGSVSYFAATNQATTNVASGAHLTTRASDDAAWSVELAGTDFLGEARTRGFADALSLEATVDITALHSVGDLALANLKSSSVGDGGTALGGSVGYADYTNAAVATVQDGAVLQAGDGRIGVAASTDQDIISLALQAGHGGSIGVNGTASALDLDSRTIAGVGNRARLDAAGIGLSAEEDLFVWSVAGAVTMSDSLSVGASVAYQDMRSDTRAFVGRLDPDAPVDPALAAGQITTDALAVSATTDGMAGAVAAAGAVAMSKDARLKAFEDKLNAENPGFMDRMKTRASGQVSGLESKAKTLGMESDGALAQYFNKAKDVLGGEGGGAGGGNGNGSGASQQPSFGVSVSGSATVNRSRQRTRASLEQIEVVARTAGAVDIDVAALNKTLLVSLSGAVSATIANSNNSSGSAAIAGGVAYGDIANTTQARLDGVTAADAGQVTVDARTTGEQVNVGLGVGVNASGDQSTAGAAAVSATVGLSSNTTEAVIASSTLAAQDLAVQAVNASRIANGGGALYVGGKGGVGAAVTYADVGDTTRAAVQGGQLRVTGDVTVSAASAARIVSAAAAGGASTADGGIGLGGSVVVNRVHNHTLASIDDGATVTFGHQLVLQSGAANAVDASGNCQSAAGVDYCDTGDTLAIDASANADGGENTVDAAGRNNAGSSIIAVAGMGQFGGNTGGMAFAYNSIENAQQTVLGDARVEGLAGSTLVLEARDNADILTAAIGAGAGTEQFAGVGSVTVNRITNTTGVLIGAGQGTTHASADTLQARASDEAFIGSLAGGATFSGKVGVGAAITVNEITNTTSARSEDAALTADTLSLSAENRAKVMTAAVAAGFAQNTGIQGSAAWTTTDNLTLAELTGGTTTVGTLSLGADNASRLYTLSGAVAGGSTAAVGAAVTVAKIDDTTEARLHDAALSVADALTVSAVNDARIKSLAIGGAGAGTAAVSGSNATNLIDTNTSAILDTVTEAGNGIAGTVTVAADSAGAILAIAGAVAGAGTAAVGVATTVNDVRGNTRADVTGSTLTQLSQLSITAGSDTLIRSLAIGGAGAGTAAVSGSNTTNLIDTHVDAHLAGSRIGQQAAGVVVAVRADDEKQIDSLAGTGAGAGVAGVGAAVSVNRIDGGVSASVGGNAAHAVVLDGTSRLDIAANDRSTINSLALAGSGGGAAGVAGSATANYVNTSTDAQLAGTTLNGQAAAVTVTAGDARTIQSLAGSGAGGGAAGVGAAVSVNEIGGQTVARVTGQAHALSGLTSLDVQAASTSRILSQAVGAAGGGAAGVGGSNTTNLIDSDTTASVDSVKLSGSQMTVAVAARDGRSIDSVAGAAGGGGAAGVGAAVSVNMVSGDVLAQIDAVGLQGLADLGVSADSATTIRSAAIAAAGGGAAGVGGSSTANTVRGQTQAALTGVSGSGTEAQLAIDATDRRTIDSLAGAAAGGGAAGVGAAVSVNDIAGSVAAVLDGSGQSLDGVARVALQAASTASIRSLAVGAAGGGAAAVGGSTTTNLINSSTTADLIGGTLAGSPMGMDVVVAADDSRTIASLAGSAAGGGAAGVGAAISVNDIDGGTRASVKDAALTGLGDLAVSAHSDSLITSAALAAAGGGAAGVGGSNTTNLIDSSTEAEVLRSTLDGDAVTVDIAARDGRQIDSLAGAAAGGVAGVGAAVSVNRIEGQTRAALSGQGHLADGVTGVAVTAHSDTAIRSLAVGAAGAGVAGAQGSATGNTVSSDTIARLDGYTLRGNDAEVGVTAEDTRTIASLAGAAAAGGTAGVGAAVSINTIGGKTSAVLQDLALEGITTLTAQAATRARIDSAAEAFGGGLLAGVAGSNATNLIDSQTDARLEAVVLGGDTADVTVAAHDARDIRAMAGGAGAGMGGVGAAVAWNEIGGGTTATVTGAETDLDVRNLLVLADAGGDGGSAGNRIQTLSAGAGGGGVGGAASVSVNRLQTTVRARIGDGADIVAQDNVGVLAAQSQVIDVLAGSVGAGLLAGAGVGTVVNVVDGVTEAGIDGSTTRVTALGQGEALTGINSGVLYVGNAHAERTSMGSNGLGFDAVDLSTGTVEVTGLAINAATTQSVRTAGVSAAASVSPFSGAVSVMTGVNQIGGQTLAHITDATINGHGRPAAGEDSDDALGALGQQVDVRASHHVALASYLSGVSGSGGVGASGALSSSIFDGEVTARIQAASLHARDGVTVQATGSTNLLALVTGLAGGLAGGAASGIVNYINTDVAATVVDTDVQAGSLDIVADNDNAAALVGGNVAIAGATAVAGTALVNVNRAATEARLAGVQDTSKATLGDALTVSATSRGDFAATAISGAGAGGMGVAGMAQLHLLENNTRAVIENVQIDGSDITVHAADTLRLDGRSGAVGVGLGQGIGAGASVAVLGSTVEAGIADSVIQSVGAVDVSALSDRVIDLATATAGAGLSVGIGGAAGLIIAGEGSVGTDASGELGGTFASLSRLGSSSSLDGAVLEGSLGSGAAGSINDRQRVDLGGLTGREDRVSAQVVGSTVSAAALSLDAQSQLSTVNRVGALGAGMVGAGGAFGLTRLRGVTEAVLEDSSVQSGHVAVTASAGESDGTTAQVDAAAGGAGLVGVGAAVAIADVGMSVAARVAGGLTSAGGDLNLSASDASTVTASADGRVVGALAAGAVIATAQRNNRVSATLAPAAEVQGFDGAAITAAQAGRVHAVADGAAGGLGTAVNGAVATADDRSSVVAGIGAGSTLVLDADGLQVKASAEPDVAATARGAAVGGGLAVGASVAGATSSVQVDASIGAGTVVLTPGAVSVTADIVDGGVKALARAGAGSLFLSANGAVATAKGTDAVRASLGEDVLIAAGLFDTGSGLQSLRGGDLTVEARHAGHQQAEASGVSVSGLLALGAVVAEASGQSTVDTRLGDDAVLHVRDMRIEAEGNDVNRAKATAGAGGLIAGNAAVARTRADSQTHLTVGTGVDADAERIQLLASHTTGYAGQADSTGAGVLQASGAVVDNRIDADVLATVGEGTRLVSGGSLVVRTDNTINSLLNGGLAARAAGGGVLSGSAVSVNTVLDGSSAIVIGRAAELASGKSDEGLGDGALEILANTAVTTDDQAGLTTGGAIDVAVVSTRSTATLANRVTIADNARLNSDDMLNVGTHAHVGVGSKALVNTWGVLAAVGKADARVDVDVDQDVSIGRGALLESLGNAYVAAGEDGMHGRRSLITGTAVAQGYSKGLIAVPDASATSNVDSHATARLAEGSRLLSGAFVSLGAFGEQVARNADGSATGYQVGFIPVTVRDNRQSGSSSSDVVVDGEVVAGRFHTLDIQIDAAGNLKANGGTGDLLGFERERVNSQWLKTELNGQGNGLFDSASGQADNTWVIGGLYAGGGDVYLNGSRISGKGSIQANGTPTITIQNQSADNLYLAGDMLVPDYAGGNIFFTGGASTAGGVQLDAQAGNGRPAITVRNTGSGAIVATGDLMVSGGDLQVYNALGSIYGSGLRSGNTVNIEAPNGNIEQIAPGDLPANDPRALWGTLSLARDITVADDAAAYIANFQYGAQAKAAGKSLTDYLLYRNSDSNNNNGDGSILVYGACLYRVADQNCNSSALKDTFYDNWVTSKYSHNNDHLQPKVGDRVLKRSYASEPSSVSAARKSSSIVAGASVKIKAGGYIDLNVPVYAGKSVDLSVRVINAAGLDTWVARQKPNAGVVSVPTSLLAATGSGSQLIALKYDTVNRQFVVDDIQATGGGSIYLDGKIVSTTTLGSLNVQSGKGSVVIDTGNNDIDLRLGNVAVGNGSAGMITIRDRQKNQTSWYVRDSSGTVTGWQGGIETADWQSDGVAQITSTGSYNPLTGMKASWTERARISRSINVDGNGFFTAGNWFWTDAKGNKVQNGQQWTSSGVTYSTGGTGASQFETAVTGGALYDGEYSSVGYRCEKGNSADCRHNYGFPNKNSRLDSKNVYRSRWLYQAPDSGTITITNTVKADNPIGINFIANDAGVLSVKAGGDILLGGKLKNTDGTTSLTSVNGDILAVSSQASIVTNALRLSAGGSIGVTGQGAAAAAPLSVELVSYLTDQRERVPVGSIQATAGKDIALDVASDAAVRLSAGTAAKGYGDIVLSANGNITGIAGDSVSLTGRDITLTSRYGSIGALDNPLQIRANERWRSDGSLDGGLVTATAYRDVSLRDLSGDFWVKRIEARYGDARVEAAAGSIFGASERGDSSFLSEDELAILRDNLKLQGGGGEQAVASYQSGVDAAYRQYFQFLSLGQVENGRFVADARAIALYRSAAEAAADRVGLDDADVAVWLADRFDAMGRVFADAFGEDWQSEAVFTAGFNADYRYRLDDLSSGSAVAVARKQSLYRDMTENAVWSNAQLSYVINANALEPSTGTARGGEVAVSGRNVTLVSAQDIGRLDKTYTVTLANLSAGNVTADEALALRLATTPGDVQLLDAQGNALTTEQIRDGAVVASLRINSATPLVIDASGRTDVDAAGDVYLHALGTLALGDFASRGSARLSADGDITVSTDGSAVPVRVEGDLSLNALRAIAGAGEGPLTVQVNGRLLLAAAGTDIRLRQNRGDLRVGIVSADGSVSLEVPNGHLLSYLKNVVAITGRQVQLVVRDDLRDEDGGALALRVQGGTLDAVAGGDLLLSSPGDLVVGTLDAGGDLRLAVTGGQVAAARVQAAGDLSLTARDATRVTQAIAGGNAVIDANLGDVQVDSLQVDGAAGLHAGGALLLADARVGGLLSLLALDQVRVAADGVLTVGEGLSVDAHGLQMGQGSAITAGSSITIASTDDIQLGRVAVDSTQGRIDIQTTGALAGNTDQTTHVVGAGLTDVVMAAGTGIGSAAHAVGVVAGGQLQVASATGDLHLHLPRGGVLAGLRADTGNLHVDSDGALDIHDLLAGRDAHVTADGLDVAQAVTGGDLTLSSAAGMTVLDGRSGGDLSAQADGPMQLGMLDVRGDLQAGSGGALSLSEAAVTGGATLVAGGDLLAGELVAGGPLRAEAGGTLTVDAVQAASAVLEAAGALHAGQVRTTGNTRMTAGAALAVTDLQAGSAQLAGDSVTVAQAIVGGDLAAAALHDLRLDQAAVIGAATLTAGRDLTVDRLSAGSADLSASSVVLSRVDVATDVSVTGDDVQVLQVVAGGDAHLEASNDLRIDDVDAGGDLVLVAGRDLRVVQSVSGGDMTWTAGNDLQAGTVEAGCRFDALAGGAFTVQTLTAGCAIAVEARDDIRLSTIAVPERIALVSQQGHVAVDAMTAGTDIRVEAGQTLQVGQGVAGGSLSAVSAGRQQWAQVQAGDRATLQSGDSIVVQSLDAGSSAVVTAAANLDLTSLAAASAELSAGSALQLGQGRVADRLVLAADTVDAHVVQQPEATGPLTTVITGYRDGRASQVQVEVDARDAWVLERLSAVEAELKGHVDAFTLHDADVSTRMSLTLPQVGLRMDNTGPAWLATDVQLFELDGRFRLQVNGTAVETDAFVLHYGNHIQVTSPNFNPGHQDDGLLYAGESAIRHSQRTLGLAPWWNNTATVPVEGPAEQEWIDVPSAGVNAGAPN